MASPLDAAQRGCLECVRPQAWSSSENENFQKPVPVVVHRKHVFRLLAVLYDSVIVVYEMVVWGALVVER